MYKKHCMFLKWVPFIIYTVQLSVSREVVYTSQGQIRLIFWHKDRSIGIFSGVARLCNTVFLLRLPREKNLHNSNYMLLLLFFRVALNGPPHSPHFVCWHYSNVIGFKVANIYISNFICLHTSRFFFVWETDCMTVENWFFTKPISGWFVKAEKHKIRKFSSNTWICQAFSLSQCQLR